MKVPPFVARRPGLSFLALLAVVLAVLFWETFVPGRIQFSNDGPLAMRVTRCLALPAGFTGLWSDLNAIGGAFGINAPDLSSLIRMSLGPVGYAKFASPIVLFIAGACAWYFFRRLGFASAACCVGGLAVALNSDFFSTACWGVDEQLITFGMSFLAMGFVVANKRQTPPLLRWTRLGLAGMAVGMGVMEAGDIGAILSVLTAAFVVFYSLVEADHPLAGFARGVGRTVLIAAMALWIAASVTISLISTQIQGVVGTEQDAQTKAAHWGWATQWSMPKMETLGLAVPGLYGYRIYGITNTQETMYWGGVGRDPSADRYFEKGEPPPPGPLLHFIGSGIYAGIPVLLVAFWAAFQAARRKDSVFDSKQRKLIAFWSVVAVVSLLLSFGRFAPFYQFFYALPYASTIRNPVKFLHVLAFALVVLFAYGADGLWRRYLSPSPAAGAGKPKSTWETMATFDKYWIIGCGLALGLGVVAWQVYVSSRESLEQYIQKFAQFDPSVARIIAAFSICQVGWSVLFLALSVGLMSWILLGKLRGSKGIWGMLLLGLVMTVDLGRANQPWMYYWNIEEKYATNPIIDILRDKPYEHREALLPWMPPEFGTFFMLYGREWREQHFVYYNIETLDVVQQPRLGTDLATFEGALQPGNDKLYLFARRWQLTNTRYLLGPAVFLQGLNQDIDPVLHRFRIAAAFDLAPKPGVVEATRLEQLTAEIKPGGQYALFEFTGALPRAKLYTRWQVSTNDQQTLQELTARDFDPLQTVLVANALPPANPANAAKQDSATVQYTSYAPKRIELRTQAEAPTVLLLNDRYHEDWHVTVDGQPAPLLRCNFIMRGVSLPAGAHTVEFRFRPPLGFLYVTFGGLGFGVLLLGLLAFASREETPEPESEAQARPAAPRAP